MAWKPLPDNYKDAAWNGLRKYVQVNNEDDTVSFQDVTNYSQKDDSFFGAKDANAMNRAINVLMGVVENGTNLYEDFSSYFENQKKLFQSKVKSESEEYQNYQSNLFNDWFQNLQNQLSGDVAGKLQQSVNTLQSQVNSAVEKITALQSEQLTSAEYADLAERLGIA